MIGTNDRAIIKLYSGTLLQLFHVTWHIIIGQKGGVCTTYAMNPRNLKGHVRDVPWRKVQSDKCTVTVCGNNFVQRLSSFQRVPYTGVLALSPIPLFSHAGRRTAR